MRAIDSVRGIFLGQTAAQFCALPQLIPPSSLHHTEALGRLHFADGMGVEKPHLGDRRRAHEFGMGIDLRAAFKAAAAGHAGGKDISAS